jgi:hypothetical protein
MRATTITREDAGVTGEQNEKIVRGTVKLANEVFAENVEVHLIAAGNSRRVMDWCGTFILPDRFNNSHLTDGAARSRFLLSLDDGRSGQFIIRAFHFRGDEQLVVDFRGIGLLA